MADGANTILRFYLDLYVKVVQGALATRNNTCIRVRAFPVEFVIVEEASSAKTSGDQGPSGNVWDMNASAPQLRGAENSFETKRPRCSADNGNLQAFGDEGSLTSCPSAAMRGTLGLKDLCPKIWRGKTLTAVASWTCNGGLH